MAIEFGMAKFAEFAVMPKAAIMVAAETPIKALMMAEYFLLLQMRFAVMQAAVMTKSTM